MIRAASTSSGEKSRATRNAAFEYSYGFIAARDELVRFKIYLPSVSRNACKRSRREYITSTRPRLFSRKRSNVECQLYRANKKRNARREKAGREREKIVRKTRISKHLIGKRF